MAKLSYSEVQKLVSANNNSSLSTELLICLVWKESGFDPDDKSKSSSASGLMQMTKAAVEDVNRNTPKGVHFKHSEMTDATKNIQCGTHYLKLRIARAGGDIKAGLNGYGTGEGYADNILQCEKCLQAGPKDVSGCLQAIHK
jgi:soluble lytic murein transglycosylase-like protein